MHSSDTGRLGTECCRAKGPGEALCEVGIGGRRPSLGDDTSLRYGAELPPVLGNGQISSRGVSKTW